MSDSLIIWLIDDDISHNYVSERIISIYQSEMIKTIAFNDAREAISLLSTGSDLPNLIFLDWHMTNYGGKEFLEDFIKLNPSQKIKIVVITATDYLSDVEIINSYNLKYLPKPLTIEDLEDILGKRDKFNSVKNMLRFLSKKS